MGPHLRRPAKMSARVPLLIVAVAACSSDGRTQADCDKIAADIRARAVEQYGQPAQGACNNPALKPQFDKACADLAACQAEVDD
jgi:hypothetical protein